MQNTSAEINESGIKSEVPAQGQADIFHMSSGFQEENHKESSMPLTLTQTILTGIFPFLNFKFPNTYPFFAYRRRLEEKMSWIFGFEPNDGSAKKGFLQSDLLRANYLLVLLTVCMIAVSCIVFICFSYNPGSSYPQMGDQLFTWLTIRNFTTIVLMHFLCIGTLRPNFDRIKLLGQESNDVKIGVFHTMRHLVARIYGTQSTTRWFTTFLSDSILLTITYIFYVIYAIMCAVLYGGAIRIIYEASNIYRSVLTYGFIVYGLDYAPKNVVSLQPIFGGILLANISFNLGDFFVFIGDKPDQPGFVRAFGAGAQLFITHSCVLLLAFLNGHHKHLHVIGDLPWGRGLIKLLVSSIFAIVWLVYALFYGDYSRNYEGAYLDNWIPMGYPYVLWVLNLLGGVALIIFAMAHAHTSSSDQESTKRRDGDGEVDEGALDEMMILVTFAAACVYYSSQIFGNMSLGENTTLSYWITSPVAPIGLALFAAVVWGKRQVLFSPARSRGGLMSLYIAFFLAGAWLSSIEVAEDCHLNSGSPMCCEYPGLPDVNHVMAEEPARPVCGSTSDPDGNCSLISFGEDSTSTTLTLVFTATTAETRAVNVSVYQTSGESETELLFHDLNQDISSLVKTTTCRNTDSSYHLNGETIQVNQGCYGQYIYSLPRNVSEVCSQKSSAGCKIYASILNCAFIQGPVLGFLLPNNMSSSYSTFSSMLDQPTDRVESAFYQFYVVVGMAALLECFFTLLGVVLKLIFIAECQSHQPHQ